MTMALHISRSQSLGCQSWDWSCVHREISTNGEGNSGAYNGVGNMGEGNGNFNTGKKLLSLCLPFIWWHPVAHPVSFMYILVQVATSEDVCATRKLFCNLQKCCVLLQVTS